MDTARNMGQDHKKETAVGEDKFDEVGKGERPLQKEKPRTG